MIKILLISLLIYSHGNTLEVTEPSNVYDLTGNCHIGYEKGFDNEYFVCSDFDLTDTRDYYVDLMISEYDDITSMNIRLENCSIPTLTSTLTNLFQNTDSISIVNCSVNDLEKNFIDGFHNLETVILSKNNIENICDNCFENMKKIRVLDLSDNHLKQIRSSLGFQDFYNNNNNYYQYPDNDDSIPKENQLNYLFLQNNMIKSFPKKLVQQLINLKRIDLNGNLIKYVPLRAFKHNYYLEEIYLNNNNIRRFHTRMVLSNINQLKYLDLSMNPLELFLFTKSHTINASNTKLKHCHIHDDVSVVYANDCEISDVRIYNTKSLKKLELRNNKINDIKNITKAVNLEYLDLSQNHITSGNNSAPLDFYLMMNLDYLNLSRCNLNDNDLNFYTFQYLLNLTILDLSYNNFTEFDGLVLYPLRNLKKLYLQGNHIKVIDYKNTNIIKPTLNEIDLSNNDWNCKYLSDMILYFQNSLQSINISNFVYDTKCVDEENDLCENGVCGFARDFGNVNSVVSNDYNDEYDYS